MKMNSDSLHFLTIILSCMWFMPLQPEVVSQPGLIEVLGHLKACLLLADQLDRLGDQLNQLKPFFFVSTICGTYHHQLSNP